MRGIASSVRVLQRVLCVRVPCGEGVRLPFIGQGEGELQVRRTIQLHGEVWHAPPWRWRPPHRSLPRSSHHGASCTRTAAASRSGVWWLTVASSYGLEVAVDVDPYGVQWQAWRRSVPACSTASEWLQQRQAWGCRYGGGRTGSTVAGMASRRPSVTA
jgi:hypothetical protein